MPSKLGFALETILRHLWLAIVLGCLGQITWAQSAPVQLCVANMQISGSRIANPAGRELLLKFLGKEKDASVAQDVPIDALQPDEALQQAKAKNCDYVITTNQIESHSDSTISGAETNINRLSTPTFYVTTTYKLTKVSDGSEVLSGNAKASDRGSEQNAVGFTMHKIANKVTEAIKKAGPAK